MKKEDRGFHGPFCFKHGVQPCFFAMPAFAFFKGEGSFLQGICESKRKTAVHRLDARLSL